MGLDSVELIMEVEDEFDIKIEDREASEIRTVEDLFRIVQAKVNHPVGMKAQPPTDQQLWESLRAVISKQLGIPQAEIYPHSRFIEDFNID